MTWTDPEEAQSLGLWLNWLGIGSCTCPYAFQQLGKLYGVSMGPGWVRLKTTPGCGEHDEKKPKDEMTTTPEPLCVATYDEPQRKDRADTHTCNLVDGHTGPHYCDLCGSWWAARVGVVPDPHPRRDRDQIALARMDASLLGTGWLMVTRDEGEGEGEGAYSYRRIDPVRVNVGSGGAGGGEEDLAAAVRRTAARSLATMRFAEKLTLLIRRAEMRKDQMRGWIAVGPLKDLLLGLEANGGNSGDSAKKP